MNTLAPCNEASLAVYIPSVENPWNKQKVINTYKRLGFGASQSQIITALSQSPSDFIDALVDEAINMPPTAAPIWANWEYGDYANFDEENQQQLDGWRIQALDDMLNNNLRDRLTFFWSNHFVTRLEQYYCAPQLFKYYNLLQIHAIGDFKQFVHDIGLTPAMLIFLNGVQNTKFSPNENYARELYELFTLGENNGYTQQDIVETSRALTGYNATNGYCTDISFNSFFFDDGEKTIFGRTGNWDYKDVIDVLFEERAPLIATFICRKLYKFFVSNEVNETIVSQMATTFLDTSNYFQIGPVLRQLFKSEHFFDQKNDGVILKSPFDLTLGFMKETEFAFSQDEKGAVLYFNSVLGQEIFQPVDVAGWQRDKDWINTSTITGRWLIMQWMCWWVWNSNQDAFRNFALNVSSSDNDPAIIAKDIIDRLVSKELHSTIDYDTATDVLKGDVPQNYYDSGQWNLYWDTVPWQVINLFFYIIKMPEFQLK
ncbi:DUF1800 family protein [Sungkyunkwania multivorans]|uniref:DUF1800 family protein n=1 Tax=Sungkyunkwania multivorans TaxID=1173618 RepID=A0ABW3D1L0_9FLAO